MKAVPKAKTPITNLREKRERLMASFLDGWEINFSTGLADILDEYFRESLARSVVGPVYIIRASFSQRRMEYFPEEEE